MRKTSFHSIRFVAIFLLFTNCFYFSVLGQPAEKIKLGILTDCQYCNCENGENRFYPYSLKKLDTCIAYFNSQELDLVFHLGDIIDHGFSNYDSVIPRFRKFSAPVYLVLGNHDYAVKDAEKNEVMSKSGMKNAYYSITKGSWQFIVLNGDDLSFLNLQNPAQKKERNELLISLVQDLRCNFMPWNGGIGHTQMKWLENQLSEADQNKRKVIILCHFPVYPQGCYNLWNDRELLAVLGNHQSVKAYFNGHYHAGNYGFYQGIHFINFKGMVQTPLNAFATVFLTSDSIFIEGFGREESRRLKISR